MSEEVWAWLHPQLHDLRSGEHPDSTWDEVRERFRQQTDDHPAAALLIERLDLLPDEERERVLGGDELDALAYEAAHTTAEPTEPTEAPAEESPAEESYDEAAWHEFAQTNLARWNGDAGSWTEFRAWFAYYAAEASVGVPAETFLQYVDGLAVDDRIATFLQYGVVITPPDEVEEPPASTPALDAQTEAAVDEVLDEHPEFAEISEERRLQLIAEVMAEQALAEQT
ncbi:hypothetical protein [Actinophytocola sp.]|jgi:hypothetical protein|uniref:hypothetical protein n=1 Tax=Actinophytocola sp. TaxID=1872138 RepID=UPI002ED952A9